MKKRAAVVGTVVACAALAVPAAVGAQDGSPAERVESFTHLAGPRVELGEPTPGGSEMRRLCPNRLDVCQKYWEYTTYFVDKYTKATAWQGTSTPGRTTRRRQGQARFFQ